MNKFVIIAECFGSKDYIVSEFRYNKDDSYSKARAYDRAKEKIMDLFFSNSAITSGKTYALERR